MKNTCRKSLCLLLSVLLVLGMLPMQAYALSGGATYYVSTGGSDEGDGSRAAPFATLAYATTKLAAGDTLILLEGDYAEPFMLSDLTGVPGMPITVRGEGNVRFSAITYNKDVWKDTAAVIRASQYLTIENISFHFASGNTAESHTMVMANNENVIVRGCTFTATQNGGDSPYSQVMLSGTTNSTLDGNLVDASGSSAFYQWNGVERMTFTNNIVKTNCGLNIGTLTNSTIVNNTFVTPGGALYRGSFKNNTIANNVFLYANGGSVDGTNTITNNAFTSADIAIGDNSVVADETAMFVGGGNYAPADGSPLIGVGSAAHQPAADFNGNPRLQADIGAIAYSGAVGPTVVVSPTGSDDSGNGSIGAPYATFAKAKTQLAPGKTLLIRAGVYTEPLDLLGVQGSAEAPVLIRPEAGVFIQAAGENSGLNLTNAQYVDITGLRVVGMASAAPAAQLSGAQFVGIAQSEIISQTSAPALATGPATTVTVKRSVIESAGTAIDLTLGATSFDISSSIVKGQVGFTLGMISGGSVQAVNNTIAASQNAVVSNGITNANLVFINNIMTAGLSVLPSIETFTYNCYAVGQEAAVGKMLGAGEFVADPLMNADYTLQLGSPCIGTGNVQVLPQADYMGESYVSADIGAFSYQGVSKTFAVTQNTPTGSGIAIDRQTSTVKITFNEPVDLAQDLADLISVTKAVGTPVSGQFTTEAAGNGTRVIFTPDADYDYSGQYTVTVKNTLRNVDGKTLKHTTDFTWTFTAEAFVMDTYYLAPNGRDTNPGTMESPKKTFASIKSVLKPGDTVIWREGTYDEYIVFTMDMPADAAPITFKAQTGETAILTASSGSSVYATFYALGKRQNLIFDGLTFSTTPDQESKSHALRFYNYGDSRITVKNCTFINCDKGIAVIDELNQVYKQLDIYNNTFYAAGWEGIYLREARVADGSYGKIYNNVVYGAKWSLNMWGRSKNLLIYNNTFADQYDADGGRGWYDVYPVQGSYNKDASPENISEHIVFKNNIFTKPIRTQLEGGRAIVDSTQSTVFDHNVYASNSLTSYVTYNYGGEGPALSFSDMQSYQGRGMETGGVYGAVSFVDVTKDARLTQADNAAIGAAADEIVPGVNAPTTDINGKRRLHHEAGAFAYDASLAFVGSYAGSDADGSLGKPYSSISAAVAAGATEVQMLPGTYSVAETVGSAVRVTPYGGAVTITGNVTLDGSQGDAILLKGLTLAGDVTVTGADVTLQGNTISGTLTMNSVQNAVADGNIFSPGASDAITLSGTDSRIINNVITERNTGVVLSGSATGNVIYNNTFYGNNADLSIAQGVQGNLIGNNIISAAVANRDGNTFTHNLYNRDTIDSGILDTIVETGAVKASPVFLSVSAKDYRLHMSSPAVGAGVKDTHTPATDITGSTRTNPCDIGAYNAKKVAVSYYVDAVSGSDTAAGTADAPFKTIAHALTMLRSGERVVIRAGSYNEDIVLADRAADGEDTYTIEGESGAVVNGIISLSNAHGVTLGGLTVRAGARSAVTVTASDNVILKKITLASELNGLETVNSRHTLLEDARIRAGQSAVTVAGAGNTANALTIERSRLSGGVQAADVSAKAGLTVRASVLDESPIGISAVGAGTIVLANNTIRVEGAAVSLQNTGALKAVNNIFSHKAAVSDAFVVLDRADGMALNYNLYDAGEQDVLMSVEATPYTLADARTAGLEGAGLTGSPLFTNAANGDYALKKGSAASRKGAKSFADITVPANDVTGMPYSVVAQDIGAYMTVFSVQTYHLAGDGVGLTSGDGSEANPFRNFSQAIAVLDSGDTLIVHKGVYTGRNDMVNKHGTADAPIIIEGCTDDDCALCAGNEGLEGPIFTGKSDYTNRDETASHEMMLKLTNCSYIEVRNLKMTGFLGAGIWTLDCDHITLENLDIWDIDNPAEITSGVQGLLINSTNDSLFHDIRIWDIGQTRKTHADHGVYVGGSARNVYDGMMISNSPGGGIQFYAGDNFNIHTTDSIVRNSVFSESRFGLILCGVEGLTVTNNTFHNSTQNDFYIDWSVRGNLFQNNVFYNDRTEDASSWGAPVIFSYQGNIYADQNDRTQLTIKNNTFKNNLYWYTQVPAQASVNYAKQPLAAFMAAENGGANGNTYQNILRGNPQFVNDLASVTDAYARASAVFGHAFKIQAGSAAMGAGLQSNAPTFDILGVSRASRMDIGAYQGPAAVNPTPEPGDNGSDGDDGSTGGNTGSTGGNTGGGTGGNTQTPHFTDTASHWARTEIETVAAAGIINGDPNGSFRPDDDTSRAEFAAMVARLLKLPSGASAQFTDVKGGDWFASYVAAAFEAGLVNGYTDGGFHPNARITREEAMVIFSRVLTKLGITAVGDASALHTFSDGADVSAWAKEDAAKLVSLGIIKGSDGRLNPAALITRAEVSAIIHRIMTDYMK